MILSGKILVDVRHAGTETTVAKIADILNKAVEFKSMTELRAERLADATVVPTLVLAGLSLPFVGANSALAIIAAHFRHKVTTITPITVLNFFNIASKYGILFKDGRSLDLLHQIDTIVFDKTGTLTEEEPILGQIYVCGEDDEDRILRYAATAESRQQHPIARAIVHAAEKRDITLPPLDKADYSVGYGLKVLIEDKVIQMGSHRFMEINGIFIPAAMREAQTICHHQGHSLIMVSANQYLIGAIELIPAIRPEVTAVMRALRQDTHIKQICMLSGDHDVPVRILARKLGIDHYIAEASPEEKARYINALCKEGKYVCYIGDGINDAIAMKHSHVSVSLRDASTMAMDTAHIVLNQGLTSLPVVFDLARRFQTNTNVTFALQVIPTIIAIVGVFVADIGLGEAFLFGWIGLLAGFVNGTMPILIYRLKSLMLADSHQIP
uniref:ATPase, P-type (Transporting), HAD superfamily, subfamily IC n=1 Tax=Candidatus Kentrum sp. LPFa TaxID=2126335 RepID=A0A450Y1V1_9GAMM|nr:MAG: ATPase, P-type (transporting), HAD superfamily, subfamily IC [Candidatus Kentron sp. LPFa]VFK35527.1 MAG: ATPase, P-type (transporting), HAD superfamily, subfamily IC [Candidatus Kentron sp. LPFa]